jgi:hypothetical protein
MLDRIIANGEIHLLLNIDCRGGALLFRSGKVCESIAGGTVGVVFPRLLPI